MSRFWARTAGAACVPLYALTVVAAAASDARTLRLKYVMHTPNSPPVTSQSIIAISGDRVHLAYTVPLQQRQVVIESCSARLSDVQNATTIESQRTMFLLINFKPAHSASCASGKRPAVALPSDDAAAVQGVADAINRAVSGAAPRPTAKVAKIASPAASSEPAPSPSASPLRSSSPSPSPSPSATSTPRAALRDWVENDGLFWFIRMRNTGPAVLTPTGDVFDCRNVGAGCGPFARVELEPGGTATVATIAASGGSTAPTFRYRYSAAGGTSPIAGGGSSASRPPRNAARMSAQELRTAQAVALDRLHAPDDTTRPIIPARLVKRGSSRLAIGQTGTALIRLTIGADGTPQDATIVSITNKRLTAAAIETAVSSTYTPATQDGHPIAAKYVATFSFDGEDPALQGIPMWKRPTAPAATPAATTPSAPALAIPLPPAATAPASPAPSPPAAAVTAPPPPAATTAPQTNVAPAAAPSPR